MKQFNLLILAFMTFAISCYAQKSVSSSSTGSIKGHEYVDLGLSVKWATCNVGANKPEEYGDYFAWGETRTKKDYSWKKLKYCKYKEGPITKVKFSKYVGGSESGIVDNKLILDPSDDAAHVNWGASWRMPTKEEQSELRERCDWKWTTQNGVDGFLVTSKINGKSIFLPAAGYRDGKDLRVAGFCGCYWSSSFCGNGVSYAAWDIKFKFHMYLVDYGGGNRNEGYSVRPVCE